ncbi:MAG: hypothetical protein ABSA51_04830 [Anaerolineaceae bacterium]
MHRRRIVFFVLAILLGLGAGLFYAWMIAPPALDGTTPNTLRKDYKTDYVLMVAEVYQKEHDLGRVDARLAVLKNSSSLRAVQDAILDAQDLGYSQTDMSTLAALAVALQNSGGTP